MLSKTLAVPGSDGNPEYFFSKDFAIKGPQWEDEVYRYDNDQPAATLWYHDHALGKCKGVHNHIDALYRPFIALFEY
jgi:FtsP/CotA-like multicopper oxidase with cupredoxin domain